LAHLRAAILFVMDISEQCNKSLAEQIELFNSIKPLFTNKPILICLNKVDIMTLDDLPDEKKELFKQFEEDGIFFSFFFTVCSLNSIIPKKKGHKNLVTF